MLFMFQTTIYDGEDDYDGHVMYDLIELKEEKDVISMMSDWYV